MVRPWDCSELQLCLFSGGYCCRDWMENPLALAFLAALPVTHVHLLCSLPMRSTWGRMAWPRH